MRAVVRTRFGEPKVLEVRDVDEPTTGDTDVLVRVRASSVNPAEWYAMSGTPYVARPEMGLRRPKGERLGADFAGTVERVGESVRAFRPGDDVFGGTTEGTAFAEFVVVPEDGTSRRTRRASRSRRRARWRRRGSRHSRRCGITGACARRRAC